VRVEDLLAGEREKVETALHRLFSPAGQWPDRFWRAMEYAVFAGGKRIRPVLARTAHRAAGGEPDEIIEAACGLELIHTYSLVHDDLPAIDDDVLRRGQPTVHVAFDEATAILVGDALLTEGLLLLARYPEGESWATRRADAVAMVAEAISVRGMVGGQVEDIEATGPLEEDAELEENSEEETEQLRARISCPVLLVRGTESWASDPEQDGRIAPFQDARVVNVDGAGHWVHHDQLTTFLTMTRNFLE